MIALVSICFVVVLALFIKNLMDSKVIDEELVQKYVNYKTEYWKEIVAELNGPLERKKNSFPNFYKNAGNLLIFPAKDGLVSTCFAEDFKFDEDQFNAWLKKSTEWEGPVISVIEANISSNLSFSKWVQVLSGNGIKVVVNNYIPKDVIIRGKFPAIPPSLIFDPKSGNYYSNTLFTLQTSSDSLENIGLILRDVQLQDVDSKEIIIPFVWREMEIFGEDALKNLELKDARLVASRELNSVLAGLNLGIDTQILSSNPYSSVLIMLKKILEDFNSLLTRNDINEFDLQNFLNANPILISPSYLTIHPQAKLGSEFITDFIIEEPAPNGAHSLLVELGNSNCQLFLKNGDRSVALNHSMKQISDWRAWLRTNSRYAQESLKLNDIDADSPCLVIIGRSINLTRNEINFLSAITKDANHKTTVLTYDDIYKRSLSWYNNLLKIESQFVGR
ncbi:MAG: Shedu anti-phage system protein SduA domain-containing protein [Ignavibacteriaceae bacterium]|jgi:hypothetical protein